jgi:endogenous inhibitor of DNA gyrase (YacG/DUF329 family)
VFVNPPEVIVATNNPDGSTPAASLGTPREVRCPGCGGTSIYALSNPARPFCSERCKNMDFGAWASESFRVPAPTTSEDLDTGDHTLQ